jgi:ribosomal protein S18 acetylase RimI-like enzyme
MYVTEVAVRANARRCGAGAMLMRGVDEVAALRNVESVYLHVDVTNLAACAMYEKCGYRHLDKRMPIYAQFTASLNLHDLATHGRKHYLMCKDLIERTTWLEDDESRWDDCFTEN